MRFILLTLLLFGCSKKPTHFHGIAHTHPYHIQISSSLTYKEKKEIEILLCNIFKEIDHLYNHWNPNSLLSTNPNAVELKPIITLAHYFQTVTKGRFHPLLNRMIKPFKTKQTLPQKIDHTTYDLDGMLKGYVIDLIIEKLTEKGYTNMYAEWGGDLRVKGKYSKQRTWQILVDQHIVSLEEGALATSGAKEQLWEVNRTTYTHILNPYTNEMLKVEEGKVSFVTVKAPTCALADALATACMGCETLEKAATFAKYIKGQHPVEFWIGIWHSDATSKLSLRMSSEG